MSRPLACVAVMVAAGITFDATRTGAAFCGVAEFVGTATDFSATALCLVTPSEDVLQPVQDSALNISAIPNIFRRV